MEKHSYKKARVGLYSVGLEAYWGQFENLKSRIHAYNALYRVAIPHDVISGLLSYTEQVDTEMREIFKISEGSFSDPLVKKQQKNNSCFIVI